VDAVAATEAMEAEFVAGLSPEERRAVETTIDLDREDNQCPACLGPLRGLPERCPGCGLRFR
jgi:hypothetical protein